MVHPPRCGCGLCQKLQAEDWLDKADVVISRSLGAAVPPASASDVTPQTPPRVTLSAAGV